MPISFWSSFFDDEEGQAIVEYILMLALVISLATTLSYFFRSSIKTVWIAIAQKVVAACPECPPPSNIHQ